MTRCARQSDIPLEARTGHVAHVAEDHDRLLMPQLLDKGRFCLLFAGRRNLIDPYARPFPEIPEKAFRVTSAAYEGIASFGAQ